MENSIPRRNQKNSPSEKCNTYINKNPKSENTLLILLFLQDLIKNYFEKWKILANPAKTSSISFSKIQSRKKHILYDFPRHS